MPLPQKKLIPSILLVLALAAFAVPPLWWSAGDPPVIEANAAENNQGPANIGQAKHMAKSALDALRPILPACADEIEADLTEGTNPILDFTIPDPKTPDWTEKQKAPLLIGQLKAISAPFYTRLNAAAPAWLAAERTENGTNNPNSIFPWTAETTDDANQAIATIGQLKAVFSLRFESLPPQDSDGDGMPDAYETAHGLNPNTSSDASGDQDSDGLTNLQEYQNGTLSNNPDSDGDGLTDGQEAILGTNPNTANNPGIAQESISNGDFSEPKIGTGLIRATTYDTWASVPNWKAIVGNKIEYQNFQALNNDRANQYCELKADPAGNHGIQQTIGTVEGKTYLILMDCKARTGNIFEHNNFDIRVGDGPAPTTPTTIKSVTFSDYNWTKAAATFKATSIITTISLLPTNLTKPAFGCLVDNVTLLPVDLVPDFNRDGKIDQADSGKITTEKPWRFWVNDDDDEGETQGTDIPVAYTNGGAQDLWQPGVDGIRDLIDFFPLHFNLKAALVVMPETEFQYFLKHDSMGSSVGSSFSVLWYPEAILDSDPKDATGAGSYLKNLTTAADIVAKDLHSIPQDGLRIPDDVLLAAKNGKGVALFEARMATDKPIQIEIRKNDGTVLGKVDFPVKISPVQNMFRYKFVMPGAADLGAGDIPGDPPNWPDADRNGKHFVFAHGYNVNDTQSKGWGGEAFKRLFWSGSNARFTAFGWYGYQGQTFGITPDYQVNLDNAFGTAKSFKQFLDLLEGEKTVAGHSMGNVLVGSAMHDWGARPKNYFMLNAAAAKECYDPAEADEPAQDAAMENQIWRGYPKILRASEWHRLLPPAAWPGSDWRGKLTWRGRFANVIQNGGQTDVYNFFSSGEEVLNNPKLNTPETNNAITEAWLKANRVWAVQEKRKGHGVTGYIHTSNYGGWRFNLMTAYDAVIHDSSSGSILMKTPAQLPNPLNNVFLLHLASNPFFDRSAHPALYEPETGSNSSGSNYAYNHRNTIISEMIPCTSFAAGRNAITVLGDQNIDMDASMKTDPAQWPLSNEHDLIDARPRPWLHSDIREKAFTHNWNAYQKFVEIGNLESNN